jgi:hypothetical protein
MVQIMTPTTTVARTTATAVINEGAVIDKPPSDSGPSAGVRRLLALTNRGLPAGASRAFSAVTVVTIVAGAVLVAATAAIHLHLWLSGYRHVPRLGPLFIAQAVTGFAIAVVLVFTRHTIVVVIAAVYMAASAGGLILSATVGFVGVHDGLGVPWAAWSLTIELIGLVLLSGAGAALTSRR